ncbi:MAG: ribosome silencing factor [Actinobacteria bacterium]|nr:ribosome silencing factor [Actinomycetota bacterium]
MLHLSNEVEKIAQAIIEKKAEGVLAIYVGKLIGITDYFLIATVNNPIQAEAVVEAVEETSEKLGLPIIGISGNKDSSWILIDCGDVVVHLFTEEGRNHYRLESLWRDCPTFEFDSRTGEPRIVEQIKEG